MFHGVSNNAYRKCDTCYVSKCSEFLIKRSKNLPGVGGAPS